jgi:hypothetical protein
MDLNLLLILMGPNHINSHFNFMFILIGLLYSLATFFKICWETLDVLKVMYINISNRYPILPILPNCKACWCIVYLAIIYIYVSMVIFIIHIIPTLINMIN